MSTYQSGRVDRLEQFQRYQAERIQRLEDMLDELRQQQRAVGGGGFPSEGGGSKWFAGTAVGAISAFASGAPGFGAVQPRDGSWAAVGDPVAVKNAGAAISSLKRVSVWYDARGQAWVEPEECES